MSVLNKGWMIWLFMAICLSLCEGKNAGNKDQGASRGNPAGQVSALYSLSDILVQIDSVNLQYPLEFFSERMWDIALTEDRLYVCGNAKEYPVVQFSRKGDFIRRISKRGRGPGEFNFSPFKISARKDLLAILDGPSGNTVFIFKNGKLLKSRLFPHTVRVKDLQWVSDNELVIAGRNNSAYLLTVVDRELEIRRQDVKIPPPASVLEIIPDALLWSLELSDGVVTTHLGYPPAIKRFSAAQGSLRLIHELNDLKLKRFDRVHQSHTLTSVIEKGRSVIDFYESFSKIYWVISQERYFAGIYVTYGKKQHGKIGRESHFIFFVGDNDNVILEREIQPPEFLSLRPYGNMIVQHQIVEKNNDFEAKLFFLKLDSEKLKNFF